MIYRSEIIVLHDVDSFAVIMICCVDRRCLGGFNVFAWYMMVFGVAGV